MPWLCSVHYSLEAPGFLNCIEPVDLSVCQARHPSWVQFFSFSLESLQPITPSMSYFKLRQDAQSIGDALSSSQFRESCQNWNWGDSACWGYIHQPLIALLRTGIYFILAAEMAPELLPTSTRSQSGILWKIDDSCPCNCALFALFPKQVICKLSGCIGWY